MERRRNYVNGEHLVDWQINGVTGDSLLNWVRVR